MVALAVLLVIGFVIGVPGLAISAFVRSRDTEKRLAEAQYTLSKLARQVVDLNVSIEAMRKSMGRSASEEAAKPAEAAPQAAPEIAPEAEPEIAVFSTAEEAPVAAAEGPPPEPPFAAYAPATHKGTKSLEENLTSRWLVWLGAVAIGLSGTFLVKYVIDKGFLGPLARVTLGFVFGIALAIAGELLRQRPLQRAIAAIRVNYVPPALTASGVFIAFASVYAAYALYGLLPPLVAFAGLALVALLAIGLSLLQGPFVALMGILGAFIAPALVVSPNPSAWGLFPYLLVVEAACLAVAHYRAWWKFALATLMGAILWPVLWMVSRNWSAADALPLGLYLLLSAIVFFALRWKLEEPPQEKSPFDDIFRFDIPEGVIWTAAAAIAVVQFMVVVAADFSVTSLTFAWLAAALYFGVGRKKADFDGLLLFGAILGLAVAASMTLPGTVVRPSPLPGSPYVPPELLRYTGMSVAFGVLFGLGGFVGLWGARRSAIWAGVSACVPFLLLAIAYYRIVDFGVDHSWALLAVALAAVNVFAAERVERYRAARGLEVTLGFYAAAVVACISLAAAMTIRQAWLTVALSMQLPALAWIDTRIRARSVQVIAAIVALGVLVRLVLNYNILSYPVADNLAASWVIYGYGIPAVSFLWSAMSFRKTNVAALVKLLEGGGLAFCVLLVSLQLRLFIAGSLYAPYYGLLEQSLQSISWLSIGTVLAAYHRRKNHDVSFYASMLLLGLASAQVLFLQLLRSNPILTGDFVGLYPVLNVLLLAYVVPAAFAFVFAWAIGKTPFAWLARFAAIAGFVLVFAYISLEVTRAFQGPRLSLNPQSDAEIYTYSVVWLTYAAALLGLGIVFARSLLRFASLAIVVVTTSKVFLFDMSGLTGLYRVASFLGLGLSLVGIGYLYQRFVFQPPHQPVETTRT